jgi:hypothetical protein
VSRDEQRHDRTLVKVDREPRGSSKIIKQLLEAPGSPAVRPHDDEGVVGVLQDRARLLVDERVPQQRVPADQPLKDIGN